ncbi:MAG: geranylgeranylglycerol-phosphate geranylgeranyltransferase [Candidatus Thermoplasmatota archaeon]
MNKIEAWIRIIRPPIVFITVLGVSVGALNVTIGFGNQINIVSYFFLILASIFLSSGLMVHNDYTDLESDKVNRPNKPLPSGVISPKTANFVGIALMCIAVLLSFLFSYPDINYGCGLIALSVLFIGILYNYKGKYTGIFGHVMVAYGVAMIPYYGSIGMGNYFAIAPLAISIFFMEIGREIMVCAGDINGDIKAGYKTLPVRIGQKKSMLVALSFYFLFIPIYPISYVYNIFGKLYIVGATVFIIFLFLTWYITYIKRSWSAFERYIRTGTRLDVIFFEIILLLECIY